MAVRASWSFEVVSVSASQGVISKLARRLGSKRILEDAFDEISRLCRKLEGLEAQTHNEYGKSSRPAPTFSQGLRGLHHAKAKPKCGLSRCRRVLLAQQPARDEALQSWLSEGHPSQPIVYRDPATSRDFTRVSPYYLSACGCRMDNLALTKAHHALQDCLKRWTQQKLRAFCLAPNLLKEIGT